MADIKTDVKTMSLQELYSLEQGVEARKQELLAEFECDFTNTPVGYSARLEFEVPAEFVICLATDKHGHREAWHICKPNEVTYKILAQKIKKHTYETGVGLTLTKLEVAGVNIEQLQLLWEVF